MVTLSKADLDRLSALIGDIPYKHAMPIVQLLGQCQHRQMQVEAMLAEEKAAEAKADRLAKVRRKPAA